MFPLIAGSALILVGICFLLRHTHAAVTTTVMGPMAGSTRTIITMRMQQPAAPSDLPIIGGFLDLLTVHISKASTMVGRSLSF